MNTPPCDRLDDYLLGWLSEREQSQWQGHLAGCPACRRAAELQQQIDKLLARSSSHLQAPSARLRGRIEQRMAVSRRSRTAWITYGLAAAVLLVAATAWLFTGTLGRQASGPATAQEPEVDSGIASRDPLRPVSVAIDDDSGVLAVAVKSENPNVTIVWTYPTVSLNQPSTSDP